MRLNGEVVIRSTWLLEDEEVCVTLGSPFARGLQGAFTIFDVSESPDPKAARHRRAVACLCLQIHIKRSLLGSAGSGDDGLYNGLVYLPFPRPAWQQVFG